MHRLEMELPLGEEAVRVGTADAPLTLLLVPHDGLSIEEHPPGDAEVRGTWSALCGAQ